MDTILSRCIMDYYTTQALFTWLSNKETGSVGRNSNKSLVFNFALSLLTLSNQGRHELGKIPQHQPNLLFNLN